MSRKQQKTTPLKYINSPQMSKPIPAKNIQNWKSISTSHIRSENDLLVWYEICELEASGDYIPVMVDHTEDVPCSGKFLLHQGVQRRITITLCHESNPDLVWKEIKEVVVGKIHFLILNVFNFL
jgi:kinesin family protein 1